MKPAERAIFSKKEERLMDTEYYIVCKFLKGTSMNTGGTVTAEGSRKRQQDRSGPGYRDKDRRQGACCNSL
jgi:hypothetical protein